MPKHYRMIHAIPLTMNPILLIKKLLYRSGIQKALSRRRLKYVGRLLGGRLLGEKHERKLNVLNLETES